MTIVVQNSNIAIIGCVKADFFTLSGIILFSLVTTLFSRPGCYSISNDFKPLIFSISYLVIF